MEIAWTDSALADVVRLHDFLAVVNARAAARVVQRLTKAPQILTTQPRIGSPPRELAPRKVIRLIVDDYELRYEIVADTIYIARPWHTREDR